MKIKKFGLASCIFLGAIVGCGQNEINDEVGGSATDISTNGEMPTNSMNDADVGIGGPVQRESGNYKNRTASAAEGDSEMAKRIKVAITTGSVGTTGTLAKDQLTDINVEVTNGKVTLTGHVASEQEKEAMEKRVAGFKGVTSVNNKLQVGGNKSAKKPLDSFVP